MSKFDSPFWELVKGEHERARTYCCRLVGNVDDGDDLYQDSLIAGFNAFGQLRDVNSFKPWFYTIINNAFRGRVRRPWWRRILAGNDELERVGGNVDPTGEYGAKRRLETAFAVLDAEDRIIVTLAELEGWKIAEIAELDARSEGQIKMRLSRARSKMRQQLIRTYPDLARNLKESPGRTSV